MGNEQSSNDRFNHPVYQGDHAIANACLRCGGHGTIRKRDTTPCCRDRNCMHCHGSGYYVEHDEDLCPSCHGSGRRDC